MNVGIIGTGFGRRVVAPVFAATDGCTVIDVVSARDHDAVASLVRRSDVDLVTVHSPPFLHAAHARAALHARKAVLCDKPFTQNADEAAARCADARAAEVVALCNFEFRYAPARMLLRQMVLDGTIGTVEHVQWTHLSAGSRSPLRPWVWLFDRALGGGWIGAWASHAVDTVRFVLGVEITGVRAALRIDVRERPDERGAMHACTAEDGLTATLVLAGGATVAINSSFAAVGGSAPRLTVFGSDAVVEVVADDRVTIRRAGRAHAHLAPASSGDRHHEPMRRFAEVIRDVVTTGAVPEHVPTFRDGQLCDAVLERLRAEPFASDLA
jgi:predicted dehydrogenase